MKVAFFCTNIKNRFAVAALSRDLTSVWDQKFLVTIRNRRALPKRERGDTAPHTHSRAVVDSAGKLLFRETSSLENPNRENGN
jgi:hypothetical protein